MKDDKDIEILFEAIGATEQEIAFERIRRLDFDYFEQRFNRVMMLSDDGREEDAQKLLISLYDELRHIGNELDFEKIVKNYNVHEDYPNGEIMVRKIELISNIFAQYHRIKYIRSLVTPSPPRTNTSNEQPERTFVDYVFHDSKEVLMRRLHDMLDGERSGRNVAKVLLALESRNYLPRKSYTANKVIAEFGLICSRQSITAFTGENPQSPIPATEIQQIIDLLP